jgi:ubiquinol-cytochrome c reductase cytochrome c1 subunit
MRKILLAAAAGATLLTAGAAGAEESFSFEGPFGTFDRAALQRGFQVYKEVCSNCHAVEQLHYRDLGPSGPGGGIGFSEEEVKALAAQVQVPDINDSGDTIQRPGRPADPMVRPFPNDKAARAANNGALPPNLSLITKAREGGEQYIFEVMTGYDKPPPDMKMGDGMNYNKAFPGHQIAMPPPLNENVVTYADGTSSTVKQQAHDVVTFLAWAAEPTLEVRKQTGAKVILFLLIATALFYVVKRKVWADVH